MDPRAPFCHHPDCPARGPSGLGNRRGPSRKEQRFRGTTCGQTFVATRDTPSDRLKRSLDRVTLVLTLLGHGGPVPAIVAAFGLDERTVAGRRDRAGRHGQRLQEQVVLQGQVDLGHVQADGLSAKAVGRRLGMARAMAVPSRLWPGGMVGATRDLGRITAVVRMVRRAAKTTASLVGVAGPASSVTAFTRAVRNPVRTGRRGRPRRVAIPGWRSGPVIRPPAGRRLVSVPRRVVSGTAQAIAAGSAATGTGTGIHTASIERRDATSRVAFDPRVRRGRASVRGAEALTGRMDVVGGAANFCWEHDRLRSAAEPGDHLKWRARTPARAAGLTDQRWTRRDLWDDPIRLPPWVAPKRRGRPPKRLQAPGALPA